jgi:surface polysaccharide O-acyltransferase-like enzyme
MLLYPNGRTSLPVDLIRTIAIILVILLHASIEATPNIDIMSPQGVQLWWASDIYNSLARSGVPLFVMLSGALLLQPIKVNESLKVFFKKRFNRIGLPMIFWGAAYFAWRYFVSSEALTSNSIIQGIFAGPYYHFWYLYILIGLYLLTPLLRVIVTYAKWNIAKYLLVIWFVGTGIIPLFGLYQGISAQIAWFQETVFSLTGLIGYFILGAYIAKMKIRPSISYLIFTVSLIWTIMGTYIIIGTLGERYSQFFYDASSANVIITSVVFFLILTTFSHPKTLPSEAAEPAIRVSHTTRIVQLISQNTLPIYLFHVMVLETLQKGYLGFKISVTTINPFIEIPAITAIALLICLAVIVPLKRIPYVEKVLG